MCTAYLSTIERERENDHVSLIMNKTRIENCLPFFDIKNGMKEIIEQENEVNI